MDKLELSDALAAWLWGFFDIHFKDVYEILETHPSPQTLSKLNSQYIKSLPNYSSWDFRPDVVGVIRELKIGGKVELVLINRSSSSLSLKEIGELHCYAKLVNSAFAFLVSTSGVSNEVNVLLADQQISDRLLKFEDHKTITIFTWDSDSNSPDKNSVLPIEMRHLFDENLK